MQPWTAQRATCVHVLASWRGARPENVVIMLNCMTHHLSTFTLFPLWASITRRTLLILERSHYWVTDGVVGSLQHTAHLLRASAHISEASEATVAHCMWGLQLNTCHTCYLSSLHCADHHLSGTTTCTSPTDTLLGAEWLITQWASISAIELW